MKSGLLLMAVMSLIGGCAWAQSAASNSSQKIAVRGEISNSTRIDTGTMVELSGSGTGITETAAVNSDDTFEFRAATTGVHLIRVIASNGQVLHEEYVSVIPNQTLVIHMAEKPLKAVSRSGEPTISVKQLQHKIPAAAQKAFDKGEQAAAKGNLEQARTCFQEAVAKDPEFADAYNELGAAEASLQHLPAAAEQFQKTIDLVPEHPRALPNLVIVLAKMQRIREAGQVARRALQIVPNDGRVHYILAASLIEEHAGMEEILKQLERATADVPTAHISIAELLAQQGNSQQAIRHLEEYLLAAPSTDSYRPKVEARLAELRK